MAYKPANNDDFIFDHAQDIAYKKLRCEICGKEFMFRVTQTTLATVNRIPRPKNCSACEEKIGKALQERAPMNQAYGLGWLSGGLLGAFGEEVAVTLTAQVFQNPYAQQEQMQQFYQQMAQRNMELSKLVESKPVKEAPKIELNPKRAVQLED